MEATLDPIEVGPDDATRAGTLQWEADRVGDGHVELTGQLVQDGAVSRGIRCHDLDLVPRDAPSQNPSKHLAQLLRDRGRSEQTRLLWGDGCRLMGSVQERTLRGLLRGAPQDSLRSNQAKDRLRLEHFAFARAERAEELPRQTTGAEAGHEKDPVRVQPGWKLPPFRHECLHGQAYDSGRIHPPPIEQQLFVAVQHAVEETSLRPDRESRAFQIRGAHPRQAQRLDRAVHLLPEARSVGERPKTGGLDGHGCVHGLVEQRLSLEGVQGELTAALHGGTCQPDGEGPRGSDLEADPAGSPSRQAPKELATGGQRGRDDELPGDPMSPANASK